MPQFRCASNIGWSVQKDGLRLVDPNRGILQRLDYPEAAVWDFVNRRIGMESMVTMMKYIGGFADRAESYVFVTACLELWQSRGFVVRDPG